MAIFVGQKVFEGVEGKKPYCGFKRIPDYQGGTTNIIRPSQWGQRLFQGIWESSVEL